MTRLVQIAVAAFMIYMLAPAFANFMHTLATVSSALPH